MLPAATSIGNNNSHNNALEETGGDDDKERRQIKSAKRNLKVKKSEVQ